MNRIVLVGFTLPSLSPLANLPNSFADDFDHVSLYFGCHMSCR
jgi:CHASE2 domain-containing sensor protein